MKTRAAEFLGLLLALAVGCSTIRDAERAKDEVAPRAAENAAPSSVAKVDLRGATLRELVDFALTNRPSVVACRLAVEDARLAMRELAADAPIVSTTPWTAASLSLNGAYYETSPGTVYRNMDWRTEGSPSAGLSLDLLIWDFGRYDARAKAQAETTVAAELALVDEGYTVFGEVADAYFTLLESQALLQVAHTNEAEYAAHLERSEARFRAGEVKKLDVLRARLDLASARQTSVAASNLVLTTGADFMRALGIDASRGTCSEVLGPGGLLGTLRRGFAPTHADVAEAFAFARTNAPSMRAARAKLRAATHTVDYRVADLMPKAEASVSLNWLNPYWTWGWGVSAVQSLFEGFRKTTAVDRAVVAMRSAAVNVDHVEQELSVSIEQAIATRDNSVVAMRTARASLRSAEENLEMVQAQLTVGDVSRIDLSDSISAHSAALGDCVAAFYAGQRAEARLFRLLGSAPVYDEGEMGVLK